MSKKYLVTGGTGFIGSAIIKKLLLKKSNKVVCLDSNIRGNLRKLGDDLKKIKIITADIRNLKALIKASRKVDCLIHLAFLNGTEYFYNRPDLVLDIGTKGIINVIEACKKNKIKELIIASSSEVYQKASIIPTPENIPLSIPNVFNPRYSYATGKILSEVIAINNSKLFKRLIIFRPHNVYGPDMGSEHVIPQFIIRMKKSISKKKAGKIKFFIKGSGKETRAFNFIDDFSDGLMKIINKGKHLNIYNIGSQEEVTITGVAKLIANHFQREITIVKGPRHPGSTLRRCPDISKLKSLGYKPKVKLKEGIKIITDWYLKNTKLIKYQNIF